jgi:hypothetical protein
VYETPPGFAVPINGVLTPFCHMYVYCVKMLEKPNPINLLPEETIGSFEIASCGKPFLALAPTQRLDDNPNNDGNPNVWQVPAFVPGTQSINFFTTVPIGNGIFDGSVFAFVIFSNAEPVPGPITIGGVHCDDCFPVSVVTNFIVPCGPDCSAICVPKACGKGQVFNPVTCRCEEILGCPPCPPGFILSPTAQDPCRCIPACPPGTVFNPITGQCQPVIGCTHNFNVAQAYPAVPAPLTGFPFGCFTGTGVTPFSSAVVPGVLCLATDPQTHLLNLSAFNDPACCASPVVQFVRLTKTIPGSRKCPDTFPARQFIQASRLKAGGGLDLKEIRTWWPLMYSMPGTKFTLEIQGVCTTGTARQLNDVWCWTVVATPDTFRLLIDLFHNSELDMMEVPCIVGEDTFQALVACANALKAAIGFLQASPNDPQRRLNASQAVFTCEALVLGSTLFSTFVNQTFPFDYFGTQPAAAQFPAGPPPNKSQTAPILPDVPLGLKIGIIDTFENPCACKLITDLESIAITNQL